MNNTPFTQLVCPQCAAINRVPTAKLTAMPVCGKCRHRLLSDTAINVNDQNFQRFITKNELPVVVDFWAPWCGPCQQFAPVFNQVAGEMATKLCFVKLDTEANQQSAARFQIRSIPTLMLFYWGQEVTRLSGALLANQFRQWLQQQLAGLAR